MAGWIERHQPHFLSPDAGNTVIGGQFLVQECVAPHQEIGGGQIIAQQVGEEVLCLQPHGSTE